MDTPIFCSPLADHPHAVRYERHGLHEFIEEPLYQRLCRLTARHPAALALHEALPPGPLRPTLWLAVLHERVLAGGPARPDALAHWYASVSVPRPVDDPALPAAFDAFVARHAEVLRQHLARRGTQTNEVGRGAVLRPALAEIARLSGPSSGRPRLALFDFGASAGLNLNVAHYRAVYQFDDGSAELAVGPAGEATPTLPCRVHGALPAPLLAPEAWTLAATLGCDLQPVELRDPLARRWLSACLWPRDAERAERLRRAMALAETHPPTVRSHSDGLSLLADWLDQLPPDVTPVLWHSWVLAYFSPGPLADFRRRAEALVRERGLWWLSAEDGPRTQALSGLTPPGAPVPGEERADPAQHTFWALSGPDARSADGIGRRLLARSHPHGRWLAWGG